MNDAGRAPEAEMRLYRIACGPFGLYVRWVFARSRWQAWELAKGAGRVPRPFWHAPRVEEAEPPFLPPSPGILLRARPPLRPSHVFVPENFARTCENDLQRKRDGV